MPATDSTLVAGRGRAGVVLTVIACLTILFVPLVPGVLRTGDPNALLGIPAESVAVLLVILAVARRTVRGVAAAVFAAVAAVAILVALLDLGFRATIDRPFSPVEDGGALVDAFAVMRSALGPVPAAGALLLIAALLAGLTVAVAFAALRVGSVARAAGPRGRAALAIVTAAWVVFSLTGTQFSPGAPVAASAAGGTLVETSLRAVASVQKQQAFERALAEDPLARTEPAEMMTVLAGKDVVIAFVESYGRVAVEPAPFTDGIERVLDEGAASLERSGYGARSAFLTSPTFGGVSWLAHATLQSGLWVDSPTTYDRLLGEDRTTLTSAFAAAGWRTVAVVPSNERDWPAGQAFYGFDSILDSRDMGYRGPAFGYARMPDQYTWKVFHDRAGRDGAQPVMAEIDLVSSHTPWTPLPRMVPWARLGDGSVFAAQAAGGESPVTGWTDSERARELYAESVEYSLGVVFSYVETFGGDDLVLIVLGDHQPARIVSGPDAGHDVPVTIIAKDPAVFDAIDGWQWEHGVHPTATAPVWRMDDFRDRFVDAFSG